MCGLWRQFTFVYMAMCITKNKKLNKHRPVNTEKSSCCVFVCFAEVGMAAAGIHTFFLNYTIKLFNK